MKKYLAAGVVLLALFVGKSSVAFAATTENITGFAWSSTIGWIQFDTGVASPVTVTTATGNWGGYAWSSNIGWVSFNAADTAYCGAQANVNISTGAVTGWGRALSAAGHEAEGWNGCLELSGTNHASPDASGNGGVTMDTATGAFTGYAWGGEVVGWVQFNTGGAGGVACSNACRPSVPITTVSCSPSGVTAVTAPAVVPFTATVTGGSGVFEYSWDNGSTWSGASSYSPSYTTPGTVAGPQLKARNTGDPTSAKAASPNCGNVTVTGSLTVGIGPNPATASASPVAVGKGRSFGLKWSRFLTPTYSCTATVGPSLGHPSWSGWTGADFSTSGNTGVLNTSATTPIGRYTFTLSCVDTAPASPGPNYSASASLNITTVTENEI